MAELYFLVKGAWFLIHSFTSRPCRFPLGQLSKGHSPLGSREGLLFHHHHHPQNTVRLVLPCPLQAGGTSSVVCR